MTAPDGHLSQQDPRRPWRDDQGQDHIDILDPRFPIRQSMPASCFWEMASLRPDRAALSGLAARARADEADHQERYVTPAPEPRFVPALAHEDTIVDFRLTDGDRFPGEGEVRPEDTDTFLVVSREAEAYEARAAQRRTWRRAWRWLRAT
jgi:hypothetical protein